MATKFFLRSLTSDADPTGSIEYVANTTQGASLVTKTTNTNSSGTAQVTDTAGGTNIVWMSDPLRAGSIGAETITFNMWASESAAQANTGLNVTIDLCDRFGNALGSNIVSSSQGTELGTTTPPTAVRSWTATATATTINHGNRLLITVFGVSAGGSMPNGRTFNFYYNAATGINGDTFVNFATYTAAFGSQNYGQAQAKIIIKQVTFGQAQALLKWRFGLAQSAALVTGDQTSASDTFTRTVSNGWGTADSGGTWLSTDSAFSVGSGVGSINSSTTISNILPRTYTTTGGANQVQEVRADVSGATTPNFSNTIRIQMNMPRALDVNTEGYYASIIFQGSPLLTAGQSDGSNGAVGISYVNGETWTIRLQTYKKLSTSQTWIRAKTWKVGTAEPDWLIDSVLAITLPPGHTGITWQLNESNSLTVDNFQYGPSIIGGFAQAQAKIIGPIPFAQAAALINGSFLMPFTDNFNRSVTDAMGSADNTDTWVRIQGPTANFDVNGSELTAIADTSITAQWYLPNTLLNDIGYQISIKFKIDKFPSSGTLRIGAAIRNSLNTAILLETDLIILDSSGTLNFGQITWQDQGVQFGATQTSITTNTYYIAKWHIIRSSNNQVAVRIKVWDASTTEPGWNNDTLIPSVIQYSPGVVGHPLFDVSASTAVNAPYTWTIDYINIESARIGRYGQAQAYILPKQSYGQAQALLKWHFGLGQAQAQMRLYAGWGQAVGLVDGSFTGIPFLDTFTRTVSNGWGTSDNGDAWVLTSGTASNFSTNGSTAAVITSISQTQVIELQKTLISATGYEITGILSIDKTPSTQDVSISIGSRLLAGSSISDGFRITLNNSGTFTVQAIQGPSASAAANISSYVAGTSYNIKVHILNGYGASGLSTYGRVKVWAVGGIEPAFQTFPGVNASLMQNNPAAPPNAIRVLIFSTNDANSPFTLTIDNIGFKDAYWTYSGQAQADIKAQGRGFGQAQAYRNTSYLFDTFSTVRDSGWNFSDNRTAYGPISGSFDSPSFTGHTAVSPNATNSIVAAAILGPNQTFTTDFSCPSFDQGGSVAIQSRTTLSTVTDKGWGAKVTVDAAQAMTLALFKDSTQLASVSAGTFVPDDTFRIVFEVIESGGTGYLKAKISDLVDPDPGWLVTASTAYGALDNFLGYSFNMSASNSAPVDINFLQTYAIPFYWGFGQAQAKITSSSFATITYVAERATIPTSTLAFSPSSNTTLHNHLILIFSNTGNFHVSTVSDNTAGGLNAWQVDAFISNTSNASISICSVYLNTAITTSDTITVTLTGAGTARGGLLEEFNGLDPTTWFDQKGTNTGADWSNMTTGATPTTTQTAELLIEAFCPQVVITSFTKDAGATNFTTSFSGRAAGAYEIVSATGAYNLSGSVGNATPSNWAGAIATYKAATVAGGTTSRGYAQSQADIKAVGQGYGQTQADVKAVGYGLAQANADIKAKGNGLAQANADLKNIATNYSTPYGQTQADIKASGFGLSQAQADIKAVGNGLGQANADLKNIATNYSTPYAQGQADIKAIGRGFAQAQADLKAAGYGLGQAMATIRGNAFGQAQATIRGNVFGQAQADIKQTYWGSGQSSVDIKAQGYGLAQAQADVKATGNGLGQANADVKTQNRGFGQTQADIKAVNYGLGQSQGDIKATSYGLGQSNADIKQVGYGSGQTQASIIKTAWGSGQSNADIKAQGYGSGQANSDIQVTTSQFAQAQADIKQTYNQSAQAQSDIKAAGNGFGQCQAYIYIPQIARPVADISNDGWIRTVI